MRDKAKEDPVFRERLLHYIAQVVEECIPEEPLLDEDNDSSRLFQAYTHPDDPNFDHLMRQNLSGIVRYRQMHSRKHMPTCFKYRSKKCRSRFPRAIVSETSLNEDTGVILVKRDHHWVNNYHKWISQMTRANHDIQFLFTNNHALAAIHYVMKYITKAEIALHSKLTIAAAVRKALTPSSTEDMGKKMLLKIYNKMESYKEVGVPEAITHMLDYPDHYTDAIFSNLHTTHLLAYMKRLIGQQRIFDDVANNEPDSNIIIDDRGEFSLVSLFDDYANRGEALHEYCLYDYCSLIYKDRGKSGISYESHHPQHLSHCQVIRKFSLAIPTLLGKLLFLSKDSDKETDREDYYCLITSLFFPWSRHQLVKPQNLSWEQLFHGNNFTLSPRLLRYISNIDLLHKTKEETRIDRLQRHAQEATPSDNNDDNDSDSLIFNDDIANRMDIDDTDTMWNDRAYSSVIDEAIEFLSELNSDYYVREGVDASDVNGYLRPSTSDNMQEDKEVYYSSLPEKYIMNSLKSFSTLAVTLMSNPSFIIADMHHDSDILPNVYLTNGTEDQLAIRRVINQFTLTTIRVGTDSSFPAISPEF